MPSTDLLIAAVAAAPTREALTDAYMKARSFCLVENRMQELVDANDAAEKRLGPDESLAYPTPLAFRITDGIMSPIK